MNIKLLKNAVAAFVFVFLFLELAAAANISIIADAKNEVFNETISGFNKYFSEKGVKADFPVFILDKRAPAVLSRRIKEMKNGLIFAVGKKSLDFAVREFSADTPVVYAMVSDYKQNNAQKVTGINLWISNEKKVVTLKEIFPDANKIGVIYSASFRKMAKGINRSIEKNGMKYYEVVIESDKDFVAAVKQILPKIDYFLMVADNSVYYNVTIELLLLESIKYNVPVIGLNRSFTQSGAIMSMECDYFDMGLQGGQIAGRIINGESPNSIPIQVPRKVGISLNLAVAEKIGKKISQEIIIKASKIFN
jgi:putative tryptophan/tyrosine transport system substrate-binding protein